MLASSRRPPPRATSAIANHCSDGLSESLCRLRQRTARRLRPHRLLQYLRHRSHGRWLTSFGFSLGVCRRQATSTGRGSPLCSGARISCWTASAPTLPASGAQAHTQPPRHLSESERPLRCLWSCFTRWIAGLRTIQTCGNIWSTRLHRPLPSFCLWQQQTRRLCIAQPLHRATLRRRLLHLLSSESAASRSRPTLHSLRLPVGSRMGVQNTAMLG